MEKAERPGDAVGPLLAAARRHEAAGEFPAALEILAGLLRARPNDGQVLLALGRLSNGMGNPRDALTLLQMAQAARPDDDAPRLELAGTLEKLGRPDEAQVLLEALAQRRADDAQPLLRLSYFHRRHNDYAAAARICRRLVSAHPEFGPGWASSGIGHHIAGRVNEADACFQRALTIEPDNPVTHFARSANLLSDGRWQEGFAEFRWRRRLPDAPPSPPGLPEWTGEEPPGSRVLVWNDQGFGDAIQFLRYVPPLAARGYRPRLVLAPELVRLATTLAGTDKVAVTGQPLPVADRQIPLCDLPQALGLAEPRSSWPGPYLSAMPGHRLDRTGPLLVGLAWAGSPKHENDANRSLSLAALAPLLAVPSVGWISLQVGPRRAELASSPWRARMRDMAEGVGDFADTAAIIAQLDLVISVDSAVAHLAGALGKPAWILIPQRSDWRWLRTGGNTDWYPSLRLFRQTGWNGWPPVVATLAEELTRLAATAAASRQPATGPEA